ncbi:L,D-transpeptidase [Lutibaculum baratangense]|uniref:L,D-TPase catalytic domain-containing protein n=1 Tax=Lutibaculum baratangense AMV1 TaxID=631454 RepID=V4TKG5_9HYPH|nr:L,D-transpeptidase [Lutibaculum baratangense]ESR26353.1 hypothetical protein N177_0853 [Lutibaculum baratangense AMV1]
MRILLIVVATILAMAATTPAFAGVVAQIDISQHRMKVLVNGRVQHSWPVSTARKGYHTPTGTYRPIRMHRMWHSWKYDMSPMPHSVFFHRGWAIHGTYATKQLGRPASHGCIRLAPGNAAAFYELVRRHGSGNTKIVIRR